MTKPDRWWTLICSRHDSRFQAIYKAIHKLTRCNADKCFMLYQYASQASALKGDAAEIGLYKGGSAKLIAKTLPHKTVYMFDTFTGIPPVNESIDRNVETSFKTSLKQIQDVMSDCDNATLHKGIFPQESSKCITDKHFCFVHIDCDIYQSTMDSLCFFYDRMTPGGIIMVDDYADNNLWPGVQKSVDEFMKDKPEAIIITTVNQCAIIKIYNTL